jgi:ATP-dependent helicase/nuclease subunit B
MTAIDRIRLREVGGRTSSEAPLADPWPSIVAQVGTWCDERSLPLRDAVVLVPFLELLAPARRAFAARGAWLPRVETTRTLARSLGPPTNPSNETGFDSALDTLIAMQMLAGQRWGADWARRDRRGFERGASRVVATAHELARAAGTRAPETRAAWWERAREGLRLPGGPGSRERLIAQVALEWAAQSPGPDTDRLFGLRPSAWIVVEAGGAEPLATALASRGDAPALVIETDAPLDRPFDGFAASSCETPAFAVCDGFEDEASAAAAQVLDHLRRDERPVALVAQDRVLVRRVRALLERAGVALADETGWKLSTTRAGAAVMALLLAARAAASADAILAWLKTAPFAAQAHPHALTLLESACRRAGTTRRQAIAGLDLEGAAAELRARALALLSDLASPSRRSLPDWLGALHGALDRSGALALLRDDAAGRQALAALGVEPPLAEARRLTLATDVEALTLAEFTAWVDEVFESVTFRPPQSGGGRGDDVAETPASARPDVVVTPLARAMLRPFAALVLPGADDQRLGACAADDSLLPRRLAEDLDMASAPARRGAELLAFVQALRVPRVTLLRRRGDAVEPVAESAIVERLRLALAERGRALRSWVDPRIERTLPAAPVRREAPSIAATALPQRLSASAFEALRACPYRFFSRSVLRLGEAEELDDEVEKRDYGNWLHGVLHAFHAERAARLADGALVDTDAAAETARLLELGETARVAADIDAAAFLPFAASFSVFVPRYIAWLHERERNGWSWSGGETEITIAPPELEGVELRGRLDRIDRLAGSTDREEAELELIDYKTGSASSLKETVSDLFEDTQLAFYAALVGPGTHARLRASYLALDGTRGIEAVAHRDVEASAAALVAGAADELRRIRAGAALPPLGEGSTCEVCEARGLCRRDHWSVEPGRADTAPADE